jgi:GDP-4-dehydro-6-deoxy-D-mannose reductase
MRCLITGASGFVGPHLASLLHAHGHEVIGTTHVDRPHAQLSFKTFPVDVGDSNAVRKLIDEVRPDRIYHLAAQSSPKISLERPTETFATNLGGTINLLLAVREIKPEARMLFVGSIAEYGIPRPENLPIVEEHAFAPRSPYASSKAAADLLVYQWHVSYGMHVVRARPSQHTGPGQPPEFVCSDFARQIAAIDAGLAQPVLRVGDISVRRDFCDVRDVVRSYELLLERGRAGEAYNVGSGRATSLREIVDVLVSFSRVPISVEVQAERLRRDDPAATYLSIEKIQRDTGWVPEYKLDETLRDLSVYWQRNLTASPTAMVAD